MKPAVLRVLAICLVTNKCVERERERERESLIIIIPTAVGKNKKFIGLISNLV